MKKQKGNAAIVFAMCLPVLFGVFALATDGARALQAKARLEDAAEVASLAVAAKSDANIDDGSGAGSAVNQKIARNYIEYYMGKHASISDLHIRRLECEEVADCVADLDEGRPRFFEYQVGGTATFNSWFPRNDPIMGFGETFGLKGFAKARKYQSEAVDVFFVVDFSNSMNDRWNSSYKTKLNELKEILELVTDELENFNQLNLDYHNKVALAGFNRFQRGENDDDYSYKPCFRDQIEYGYSSWGEKKPDYQKTINKQFIEKSCMPDFAAGWSAGAHFTDIEYTDDFDDFNQQVDFFNAAGGTAFSQGVIRAGQMTTVNRTDDINPRQLIIILSDGVDDPEEGTGAALVNRGMCSNILDRLNQLETPDGDAVQGKMAVIGFDYEVGANHAIRDCVGEENVFEAEDKDEILNQILALIAEEIGHLA